jgi:hypothetical protein
MGVVYEKIITNNICDNLQTIEHNIKRSLYRIDDFDIYDIERLKHMTQVRMKSHAKEMKQLNYMLEEKEVLKKHIPRVTDHACNGLAEAIDEMAYVVEHIESSYIDFLIGCKLLLEQSFEYKSDNTSGFSDEYWNLKIDAWYYVNVCTLIDETRSRIRAVFEPFVLNFYTEKYGPQYRYSISSVEELF